MNETELAWAAGFFDGEGWTSIHVNHSQVDGRALPLVRMGVEQVEQEPLERFLAAVGCGSINGPYREGGTSTWAATGSKAEKVMDKLWPYLSGPKRRQFCTAHAKVICVRGGV